MTTRTLTAVTRPPASPANRPQKTRSRWYGGSVNLFYVPALLVFIVFTLYPLISGVGLSFTDWNGYSADRDWIGWANYARLAQDPTFRSVLVNTVIYGVGSTVIQQVLGLALALMLDRKARGVSAARAIVYLPVLVSPVIMGTMYYLLLQYNNGALNDVMALFGRDPVAWLSTTNGSIAIIVLVNSLQFVGLSMIIYMAGLQGIDQAYYEASALDGATASQQFWHVTLPLLKPAVATSVILNLIGGLKLFDIIKVLTNGGPGYSTNSVSTFIGVTYFDAQSAGYASAMGVVLFLLIMAATLVLNSGFGRKRAED
ncbi:carbohydrate ABC transporter permease [Demequina maris]|uniref:carbohydrate ABC transporter permease n=1 Tax=Demequina maris TaxID=1638982 RepID=UPI0009E2293B|nr:sugar ABC transporter permease [Demequina maris]